MLFLKRLFLYKNDTKNPANSSTWADWADPVGFGRVWRNQVSLRHCSADRRHQQTIERQANVGDYPEKLYFKLLQALKRAAFGPRRDLDVQISPNFVRGSP